MSVWDILLSKSQLVLALVSAFLIGLAVGQILFALDRERAFKVVDFLDSRRKPLIKLLSNLLCQSRGVVKAIAFIFVVNLIGASLFQHSLGGLLIVPPFVFLFTGGLLISLLVRRYPERLLITAVVAPFEFGAFVVAATGGISLGLSLWSGGDTAVAIQEWATLFVVLVIPLQFLNAFWEAVLAYRLFIIGRQPWPQ